MKLLLILFVISSFQSCSSIGNFFSSDEDVELKGLQKSLDKLESDTFKQLKAKSKRSKNGKIVRLPGFSRQCVHKIRKDRIRR
jgi:hypothetical protein